jgi:hypothetical protein
MPVFEGLFPHPHNVLVQELLYNLTIWHSLAKLRMHIDPTLKLLDLLTTSFGTALLCFIHKMCAAFNTVKLPKEAAAHTWWKTKKGSPACTTPSTSSTPKAKAKKRS